jgi:hypothetical protein
LAYVKDTLSWATDEADFRLYSGIAADGGSLDRRLEQWFDEATYQADYYMNNPFVDDDGVDIVPQPPGVRTGVYEYVIAANGAFASGSNGALKGVKTGQLAETYATTSSGGISPLGEIALRAAAPHWKRNQIDLLLSGTL